MKRIIFIIVTIIAIVMTMMVSAYADSSADFVYTYLDYDGTARIDKYIGSGTDVIIPSSIDGYTVTVIGNNAFEGNHNIISVTIPDTVTTIYKEAFAYCSNLQNITLPNSIEMIDYGVFRDCINLNNMYYQGSADDWVKIIFDRVDSNPMYYAVNEYFNDELVKNIILTEPLLEINPCSFCNCTNLQSVIIQNNLSAISNSAFSGCTNLRKITIPKSVSIIGASAFNNCNNLWHVLYEGKVTCWNNISIGSNNSCLTNATRHYEVIENPITKTIIPPTCTEQGYTTYTCECGESYIDDYVDETGHNHEIVVTKPTCTEKGYSTHTCKCGDSYVDSFVDETGHTFGMWTVTKEATTDTEGKMERACSCGKKEYKYIDKLPPVEDDKIEQEDTNKEDIKNPEIPNTNYEIVSSAYIVYMFVSFICVVAIFILLRRKYYK